MAKTEKVDNFDDQILDELFSELDAQNALLEEASKGEPTEATSPVPNESEELDEELLEAELLANAVNEQGNEAAQVSPDELEAQIKEAEAAVQLEAESELDLEEAFAGTEPEPTPEEIVNDQVSMDDMLKEVEAEHAEIPPAEVHETPNVEITETHCEEDIEVDLQEKNIPNFEPKEAPKSAKSDKEMERIVSLKYAPDVEAFNRDIQFTDATLDIAMRTQASLAAYQNERAARAAAQAARVKLKFESLEALLYEAYRKHFLTTGEKVTEKAVENAVRKDSRWVKAKEALIEAEMYSDIHKGFVYALRDRNDMLIQRGAYSRQERQGQLRMVEQQEQTQTLNQGFQAAQSAMKKSKNLT
ncbi:hypothetical protein [Acinetobacter nosocomialis]|uniref:hypothetical protein n=1 Tax=Acinetobacter nosocomialis TaxID=106654 RepID=UPI0033A81FB7